MIRMSGWIAPIEATEGMHAAARDWSIRKYGKAVGKDGSAGCYKAMRLAAPAPQGWQCKAKPTADPPQECGWPTCGCDPYADKVINALDEMGAFAPTPPQWRPDEERKRETAWLIETGDHMYWNGKHANSDGFTHDPNEAVRFARFEDSERVIHWLMNKDSVFLVSREHAWIDGNAMKDALAVIPEGEKK